MSRFASRGRAPSLLFALSLTGVLAAPCWAETRAENIAAARALGIQGIRLADEGNCAAASEKLQRALALHYAPTMLGRLGECQVQLGQIVLGTENLNRVVREQLAPDAPAAFVRAQERAESVLQRALPRIALVIIHILPRLAAPSVTISGVPIPTALLGAERPTDPGSYEIVARAPGYAAAKTNVTLADGAREELTLTLTPDPNATGTLAAPGPPENVYPGSPAPTLPPPSLRPKRNDTLAYVLLGAGTVGVTTGAVTGVLALSKEGGLACPANDCPPSEHGDLDAAKGLATVSTVSFGVGIVGAAAGLVLLLVNGGRADADDTAFTPRPSMSLQGAGFGGRF